MTPKEVEVQAASNLVVTFGRILDRDLRLENGTKAGGKGAVIRAPLDSADLYLLVERQLAHLLFKSDAKARDLFAQQFVGTTVRVAARRNIDAVDLSGDAIERLIDILENRRVSSLWGMLYPGSYSNMREHLKRETSGLVLEAHDSLSKLFACLDAEHPIEPGLLDRFLPLFRQALGMVEKKSFTATLVTARWLLSRLALEMADFMKPRSSDEEGSGADGPNEGAVVTAVGQKEKLEGLREALLAFGHLPEQLEQYYDDYSGMDVGGGSVDSVAGAVLQLDIREEGAVSELLEASAEKMEREVQLIQDRLFNAHRTRSRPADDTRFVVKYREVDGLDRTSVPTPEVQRLKSLFQKVLGRKKIALEEFGTEIDIEAYLEGRLTGQFGPCFKTEKRGRGFHLRLLVDRSGSMLFGDRTLQAEKAVRTLISALEFPFVTLSVWGFQGPDDGEVLLTKFNGEVPDLLSEAAPVEGDTPLHVAVQMACQDLVPLTGEKHLVVITDGAPMCAPKERGLIPKPKLRKLVAQQVAKARSSRVNVSALMIGSTISDKAIFEVSTEEMVEMFGPARFWQRVDERHITEVLTALVASSFLSFLKHS